MKDSIKSGIQQSRWKGRQALALQNDKLRVVVLPGGGHIAAIEQLSDDGVGMNLLWEAPWETKDPANFEPMQDAALYGPEVVGRFLSGYTGHALCLGYFGTPTSDEVKCGLPLHGEVASQLWQVRKHSGEAGRVSCVMSARAPEQRLRVDRQITMCPGESVLYVSEWVHNLRQMGQPIQWTQHVTLGPPLLDRRNTIFCLPGTRAMTWKAGYDAPALLESGREFKWPLAPGKGASQVDLSKPLTQKGKGFIAAVLFDRRKKFAYVVTLNRKLGLAIGYCFRREDYPWITLWEENCARDGQPWNGSVQARGMEFGVSPMPDGLRDAVLMGPLFGVPTTRWIAAQDSARANYVVFVTPIAKSWKTVREVELTQDEIILRGTTKAERVSIPAKGLADLEWL